MGASPVREWLEHTFLEYQLRWVLDETPIAMAEKGRQLGFTDATAGRIIRQGLLRRRPQVFISASEDIAGELVETVRKHCELLAALGRPEAIEFAVENAGELKWKSGGGLAALSSNPRTARGYHGDLYLDEFAFHADPQKLWSAAGPIATRGGWQIRVISTPNGAQGLFYDWASSPPDGWSVHRVSLDDAVADGLTIDQAKLWQLVGGDPRLFNEAYRLAYLDANLQWVPTWFADRARDWKGERPNLTGCEIHAGLDVGRVHDLTVLAIVAMHHGVAWVLALLTCKRTNFRAQRKMIRDARALFKWQSLHVDSTGLGQDMAEELQEWWGEDEVKLVPFTEQSKSLMATRALRYHRDNLLRYPSGEDGKALHAETISVRRVVTASNNVTFTVPRSKAGHGDRWWAQCLALLGAGEPASPLGMSPTPLGA